MPERILAAAFEPGLSFHGKLVVMRFAILGDPVAKGRPRTRVMQSKVPGGKAFAQVYTDPETRSWEENVAGQVRRQLAEWSVDPAIQGTLELPLRKRVLCAMRFNMHKPQSAPKSQDAPLTRPDVDNLAKAVLDALQTAQLIKDDNLVTDQVVSKRYADFEHPMGVEVELTAWTA